MQHLDTWPVDGGNVLPSHLSLAHWRGRKEETPRRQSEWAERAVKLIFILVPGEWTASLILSSYLQSLLTERHTERDFPTLWICFAARLTSYSP